MKSEEVKRELASLMEKYLKYLRENNGGIASMDWFYDVLRGSHSDVCGGDGKLAGVFCNFVPEELFLAAGVRVVRLCGGFQGTILTAEEVLPRNFCPLLKSTLGFFMLGGGPFEASDVLVLPTTCDGKKKLSEVLAEGREVWVLEVPHSRESEDSRLLFLKELHRLRGRVERLSGRRITRSALAEAVELVNEKRRLVRRLYELRKRPRVPIWGSDALVVTNAWFYADPREYIKRLGALCDELERRDGLSEEGDPRIMITGSPVIMPTWKLPVLIEESGGVIVTDDICSGSKGYWDAVAPQGRSMDELMIALADKYLMNTCACFVPNTARRRRVLGFIEDFRVDGVVYYIIQGCYLNSIEKRQIEIELARRDIPLLTIETDYSQEDIEQIRTRVEAFLEMIAGRKRAARAREGGGG